MAIEILINVMPMETRVALVEQGRTQEILLERTESRGVVGNIYKGKVIRVLPGMQAAFVDIGRDKAGFLHASDIVHSPVSENGEERKAEPDIRQLVHEGQSLVVQVYKDPIGTKGPRLTTQLSISSRYLVYMPDETHLGVSQKIDEEEERQRLRDLVAALVEREQAGGGYIIRTVAEGVEEREFADDIRYLQSSWKHIRAIASETRKKGLIFEDLPLHLRVLRDIPSDDLEKIRVDSADVVAQLVRFAERFNPEVVSRIQLHDEEMPLFNLYAVDDEINKSLLRKVPLISGGYLVIDQTEAMTTIDVNTGAFVGHRNLEDTIFKTNMEAAFAIARQLRIRNLGGIIIVDFIDMLDEEHQREVLRVFEKALAKDRAKTAISAVSSLGLVEMTRKRTSESLEHLLCETCPVCEGRRHIKSVTTVCYDILRDIAAYFSLTQFEKMLVVASPVVIERLLDEEAQYVAEMEEEIGRPIEFRSESAYNQEQYDIVPV
ncbi:MAG: ribonuclease G [bacterium]